MSKKKNKIKFQSIDQFLLVSLKSTVKLSFISSSFLIKLDDSNKSCEEELRSLSELICVSIGFGVTNLPCGYVKCTGNVYGPAIEFDNVVFGSIK